MNNLVRLSASLIHKSKSYQPSRLFSQNKAILSRTVATKNIEATKEEATEDDAPVTYTKSPAYKWEAKSSRTGVIVPRLWYEPYVILVSLSIFMIYFCVLREENQIDKDLERTLYSRISGLEEYQLRASLAYNKSHGLTTSDIEARLKELSRP